MSQLTDGTRYRRPPLVGEEQDPQSNIGVSGVEYNEKSLRIGYEDLEPGQRAEAFFGPLASMTTNESVRAAALEMQAEEAEHVALVQAWMAKVPQPDSVWSEDPDPPRYID